MNLYSTPRSKSIVKESVNPQLAAFGPSGIEVRGSPSAWYQTLTTLLSAVYTASSESAKAVGTITYDNSTTCRITIDFFMWNLCLLSPNKKAKPLHLAFWPWRLSVNAPILPPHVGWNWRFTANTFGTKNRRGTTEGRSSEVKKCAQFPPKALCAC